MVNGELIMKKNNYSFIIRYLPFIIVLLALALRLWQLPALPPGLNFDEAGNGAAALDILRGAPQVWWTIGGGKEPLWPYVIALTTTVLGAIPLAIRLPAALVGVLTVAAVYPLLRALFRGPSGRWLALLTMTLLAFSGWHLHFSRLGFRAIFLPLFSTLALYFFWRFFSGRSPFRPAGTLSALFLALSIYSYLAGRMLPGVIILFVVACWLLRQFEGKTSPLPPLLWTGLVRLALLLLAFLLPLMIHFLFYPADLVARAGTVSIFNPAWHHGDLLGTAVQTIALTLGTFVGLTGDANPLVNLPGQPAFSPLLGLFLLVGIGMSLQRIVIRLSLPHLLLLCWLTVMLLPAILAPEGAPHHLRLIGAMVPAHALTGVGILAVTGALARLFRRSMLARRLVWALPIAICLLLAVQTTRDYFWRWPVSADFTLPFDLYAARLAEDIAQAPSGVVTILPMDIRAGPEARHYSLDYLLSPIPAGYRYLPVDERNAETALSALPADTTTVRVVRWTADKHVAADEKEIVTFLLHGNAQLVGRESFLGYDLETYRLTGRNFALPAIGQPVGAVFDGLLRLDAVYLRAGVSAGDALPVALTLAPLAPMPVDYKLSLRLTAPTGERLAQQDRTLRHNFHQGTSLWPPESVNEYYLLPVPAETPPGPYTVSAVIYHPDTLAPLIANGAAEVVVGMVEVE
jgi:hypothetical protein